MEYAIQLKNVTKTFGKVVANKNVNLDVKKGEILSLLGENGSGKTTLMNMISGIYFPDSGEIMIEGRKVEIRSPKDAYDLGIGMIHQHFKLIDVFSATENIALGLDKKQKFDLKEVRKKAQAICDRYHFDLDLNQKVYEMSVSQKQTLEIVKVLYRGANILILDEPTAVLTPQETARLFEVIRNMKADNKSVIIITHKLHEVLEISDRVAILRKGEYIGTVDTCEATENSLTEMMVGKKVELNIARSAPVNPVKRLSVSHLTVLSHREDIKVLDDVSFDVVSAVRSWELPEFPEMDRKSFWKPLQDFRLQARAAVLSFTKEEKKISPFSWLEKHRKKIRDAGVHLAFVPEDRLGMGLVGSMGMTGNMLLKSYGKGASPLTDMRTPKKMAEKVKEELEVVTPSLNTPVSRLSGGNVQKVLVGREIAEAPTVLMTAYAVRGLDINTSYTIYNLLDEEKKEGVASSLCR